MEGYIIQNGKGQTLTACLDWAILLIEDSPVFSEKRVEELRSLSWDIPPEILLPAIREDGITSLRLGWTRDGWARSFRDGKRRKRSRALSCFVLFHVLAWGLISAFLLFVIIRFYITLPIYP